MRGRETPRGLSRWIRVSRLMLALTRLVMVDIVLSSWVQARLVLRPRLRVRPLWIHFQTRLQTRTGRTALGMIISVTPGTLTCNLEGDTLTLHVLTDSKEDETSEVIAEGVETLLLELERLL